MLTVQLQVDLAAEFFMVVCRKQRTTAPPHPIPQTCELASMTPRQYPSVLKSFICSRPYHKIKAPTLISRGEFRIPQSTPPPPPLHLWNSVHATGVKATVPLQQLHPNVILLLHVTTKSHPYHVSNDKIQLNNNQNNFIACRYSHIEADLWTVYCVP